MRGHRPCTVCGGESVDPCLGVRFQSRSESQVKSLSSRSSRRAPPEGRTKTPRVPFTAPDATRYHLRLRVSLSEVLSVCLSRVSTHRLESYLRMEDNLSGALPDHLTSLSPSKVRPSPRYLRPRWVRSCDVKFD